MLSPKVFPAKFDVARIFANQFRFQLGNEAYDSSRAGVGVSLAIPRNAGVRIDPNQRRVSMVGDYCRLDVNNLHRSSVTLEGVLAKLSAAGPNGAVLA